MSMSSFSMLNPSDVTPTGINRKRTMLVSVFLGIVLFAGVIAIYMSGVDNQIRAANGQPPESGHEAHRHEISNPLAVCNDGSQAVYYYRPGVRKDWIVYFDGGNACYSNLTCNTRYETDRDHMSAKTVPKDTMENLVSGEVSILSADAEINPNFHDFNVVYVQYCSSDSFLGNISKDDIDWLTPFHFRGAEIARSVFVDLVEQHDMEHAENVILASVSAGSFGAWAHGNAIMDYIHSATKHTRFRVWVDSGFWLLNEPWRPAYKEMDCDTASWADCRIDGCQQRTHEYFNAVHNEECRAQTNYTWECAFPEVNLPYQRFEYFVSQQQYDKLQIQGAGLGIADQMESEEGYAFTLQRGIDYREQLAKVDNLWTSACRKHDIIDKEQVFKIYLEDSSTNFERWTANDAGWKWFNDEPINAWDRCFTPDCNPSCPER